MLLLFDVHLIYVTDLVMFLFNLNIVYIFLKIINNRFCDIKKQRDWII